MYAAYIKAREKQGKLDKAWYGNSQKAHWLGWLGDYNGAGAYGRKNHKRSSRFIYNQIRCAPMLAWLIEASKVDKATVKAVYAVLASRKGFATQCAAIRLLATWDTVQAALINNFG